MNPTLQRAVTSFYNLSTRPRHLRPPCLESDTAEQEHYAGRIEGLNWVLDRCQELEDMDTNITPTTLQRVLTEVKSDLDHELSVQRREKGRRADGREEALTFVADYLSSLITATEIESAKTSV
ncbi:MAG: hypothetical protein MRJ92_13465 [Nitrospira sp.]|nr:hypothetical protein [Nitrospira sp.]